MTLTPLLNVLLLSLAGCDLTGIGIKDFRPCAEGEGSSILLASGEPSGFERCSDGTIYRASKETVDPTIPEPSCVGDEEMLDCTTDAECTGGVYAKCISTEYFDYYDYTDRTACACVYSCANDADCDAGEACIPAEVTDGSTTFATCQPAACDTNDACDAGACGLVNWNNGCEWDISLYCRDPEVDSCTSDADCGTYEQCTVDGYAEDEGWVCTNETCAIGRPLTTATGARTAEATRRTDWTVSLRPAHLDSLDAPARAALARHWRSVAALEHASVASFARFTLQLMSIGAPPELLAETQVAAADEVRHAQLAYGLASAYAGAPVGPAPMKLADAMPCFELNAIVRGLIEEACVGETLGAAEALYAAASCDDPVVAEVLREIALDEARHAALAWRTLQWLRDTHPELPVEAWLEQAVAGVAVDVDAAAHLEDGVLGGSERLDAHRMATAEVIRPTIARLLAA